MLFKASLVIIDSDSFPLLSYLLIIFSEIDCFSSILLSSIDNFWWDLIYVLLSFDILSFSEICILFNISSEIV